MPTPAPKLYSPTDLAVHLKKNHVTVWRAIQRLGIPPAFITRGNWRFYDRTAIIQLRREFAKRQPRKSSAVA